MQAFENITRPLEKPMIQFHLIKSKVYLKVGNRRDTPMTNADTTYLQKYICFQNNNNESLFFLRVSVI